MDAAKKIFCVALALTFGLLVGVFIVFNSVFSDFALGWLQITLVLVMIALSYLSLGFVFGYVMPEWGWIWGTILSLPAMVILVLYYLGQQNFFGIITAEFVLAPVSAMAGSYLGAGLKHPKHPHARKK